MKKTFNIISAAAVMALTAISVQAQSQLYPQHFMLSEVAISEGPMLEALETNTNMLMQYDVDRLLTPFVRQAGLSSDKNSKYYGWISKHPSFTNWGDSGWSLEGHIGGHYLTALSMTYAATHDAPTKQQVKERLDYMLDVLADCQAAYADNTEGLRGFIGGQPINQVWTSLYKGDLTAYKEYGGWVPFYCQHKVLAGLRDAWVYAGSEKARDLYRGLCDWSIEVVGKLNDSQMQDVLGSEHGGMNETLADAYVLFGEEKYLEAAKKYSHRYFINGMQGAEGAYSATFLDGRHANTQVPKYVGFERIYQLDPTQDKMKTAAHNFWDDVANHRTVCIGGNSVSEHFLPASRAKEYMTHLDGPESCNSNNMLKLSEELFDETHDARYADFYESTMWNHILATQDPVTGGYVYFTSLRPQSYKIYSRVNQGMWCCVGTGMENHAKYGHFIYTHSADNSILYVNLFTPSTLQSDNFVMTQQTCFPYEGTSTLTVGKAGAYTIALRHPAWAGEGYEIKVNGQTIDIDVTPGVSSYAQINRSWSVGDKVEITLPMSLRIEECPDYPDYIAFKHGPILLGARTTAPSSTGDETGLPYERLQNEYAGTGRMDHAPSCRASMKGLSSAPLLIGNRDEVLERVAIADPAHLLYTIDASSEDGSGEWSTLTLEPFFDIHHSRYCIYWYQQTHENYIQSDMGMADVFEKTLADRTIDFVGTGEQQSEAGHEVKASTGSTTGSYGGEYYRDAQRGGYIEYSLYNESGITDSLAIMCRFTTADKGRKATIKVEGVTVGEIEIPGSFPGAEAGFFNIEFPLPDHVVLNSDGSAKSSVRFHIEADPNTICPGLYYLRLTKGYMPATYQFRASDWKTGDTGRLQQSKITYNDNNSLTVEAGTGSNNLCLTLDYQNCNYTERSEHRYLIIVGNRLSNADGKSYMWWLNGTNRNSSVKPAEVRTLDKGRRLIAFDLWECGIADNCQAAIFSICRGQTIFGLTSTTGTSTITYIGFHNSVDGFIQELEASGIGDAAVDCDLQGGDVYDLRGVRVNRNGELNGLNGGVYIVNGRKVMK